MIYTRKHPTYQSMQLNADGSGFIKTTTKISLNKEAKKSVIQAHETITGLSFALENHTIDEESDDNMSEYNSTPKNSKSSLARKSKNDSLTDSN